jgi:hypothetical protein
MLLPTSPSMPDSAPVGSVPLSAEKGDPLWKVNEELTCHPPKT